MVVVGQCVWLWGRLLDIAKKRYLSVPVIFAVLTRFNIWGVRTTDMFLVLFGCTWYGMIYHSSLVPFLCMMVLGYTYSIFMLLLSSIETHLVANFM